MPNNQTYTNEQETRIRALTSDQNLKVLRMARRMAMAYENVPAGRPGKLHDKIVGLLSPREVDQVKTGDIDTALKILAKVPQMSAGQRMDFCDLFVGEDMAGLDLATPMILAEAYNAIYKRIRDGEKDQQERFDKITQRIDDLSADFANSGGMVVSQNEWPLVDVSNIADVYEGFGAMLDARLSYLDVMKNPEKASEIKRNKEQIDIVVSEYDKTWGLDKLSNANASKLSERWTELYGALNRADLSENTKKRLAKYEFLDNKNEVIPQYTSGKRDDKKKYKEYQHGFTIAKDGRLASVVELARHDLAKKYLMNFDDTVDDDELEIELNKAVVAKLFEIYNVDHTVNEALSNPEQFTTPESQEDFIKNFEDDEYAGLQISDTGYNAAIDEQTNATAGWAARIKAKLGRYAQEVGGFWGKIFNPIKRIDKLADLRLTRRSIDKREKRIELIVRMVKGFGSAFIVSTLFTLIITAVAAATGMSAALIMAAISTAMGIGTIRKQLKRWRDAQEQAGLPTDREEFFKNKRLILSITTSVLAIVAMCCGAGGLTGTARAIGIGALGTGVWNNGSSAYVDARDAKLSKAESIALAIANAGAVLFGAWTGRTAAHGLTGIINYLDPRNTWLQNTDSVSDNHNIASESQNPEPASEPTNELVSEPVAREVTHTKTITNYPDDAVPRAERAVTGWYKNMYPNDWQQHLTQDINAVEQYNADTESDMNPYRALRIIQMARPGHFAFTDSWAHANNIPTEHVDLVENAISNGNYDSNAMDIVKDWDLHHLGVKGEIGDGIPGHEIRPGDTYRPIEKLPTQTTETWTETVYDKPAEPIKAPVTPVQDTTVATTIDDNVDARPTGGLFKGRNGFAMFGNYAARERKTQLRDRLGSFVDRVRHGLRPDKSPKDDMPVVKQEEPIVEDEQRDEYLPASESTVQQDEFIPVKDEPESRDTFTSPVKEETDVLPPFDLTEEDDMPDKRLVEPVRPVRPNKDIDGVLRRLREAQQQRLLKPGKTPVALLNPGKPKKTPVHGPSFAITYTQAKKWDDLHANLDRVQIKLQKSSLGAFDAAKLRTQEKDIIHDIEHLYNQIGRPSMDELGDALADAYRREYKKHMAEKPDDTDRRTPHRIIREWNEKHDSLLNKFETYGWNTPLDEEYLSFPAPVMGVQTQKQSEREAMRAAAIRAEQERKEAARIAELKRQETERLRQEAELLKQKTIEGALENAYSKSVHDPEDNHFVPENLIRLAEDSDIISQPLMEIRGVPVNLVDLNGHNNPFTQNEERAMVVVDVDGLRIPFYLANGNEASGLETPGKWYPLLTFMRDGSWFITNTWEYLSDKSEEMAWIKKIAAKLDEKIGDIRNYRDENTTAERLMNGMKGEAGGVDNITQVSPSKIYSIIEHYPNNLTHYLIWASSVGGRSLSVYVPWLKWYFRNIQSPNYDERAEKKQMQEEKRAERKQKRETRRQEFRDRFGTGVFGILDRARDRFRFGGGSNEYED